MSILLVIKELLLAIINFTLIFIFVRYSLRLIEANNYGNCSLLLNALLMLLINLSTIGITDHYGQPHFFNLNNFGSMPLFLFIFLGPIAIYDKYQAAKESA